MSLLNKASLIQIPSGYKDGTLYSAKPTNGDGDFTFSRGSNLAATRVNSEGLIEKGRENLFFASDTSDSTAGRAIRGSSTTIKGVSGFLYSDDAGNPNINKSIAGYSTGFATFSIYVDTTNANTIQLNFAIDGSAINGTQAKFNATTKTWNSIVENTSYVSSGSTQLNFEDLGDNVFRLSIGANFTPSGSTYLPVVYFGTGNTNVAIGGGQVEKGLVATDYIETTTTTAQAGILEDMPRLDYSGGATCPSLILESQRSNAMANSEYFGGYNIAQMTLEHNYAISPEGVQNATRLIENTAGGTAHSVSIATPTTATEHGWSVYAKPNGRDYIYLYVGSGVGQGKIFDIANGAIGSNVGSAPNDTKIEDAGNGWYRCTIFVNGIAGSPTPTIGLANSLTSFTYTGDGTSGVFIYGAMLEAGSYPTSYIPTYGSSVTRSKDVANDLSAADLIGNDEGVIFIDVQMPSVIESNTTFSIGGGTSTEYAQIEIRTDLTINWRYRLGGTDYINANVGSYVAGDRLKIAFAYKNNDSVLYKNGSSIATDTGSVATNSWDEVRFSNFAGTGNLNASVNQTLLFKTRLSNDELAALTTI